MCDNIEYYLIKGGCRIMIKDRISLFLATFLTISFLFLALPEKGYSGMAMLPSDFDCCSNGSECFDNADSPGDKIPCPKEGVFEEGVVCNVSNQCVPYVQTRNVPTISEWGLITMAGILGLVGFIVIRRRKVTA